MLKVRNQAYEIMENGKRLRLRKIWFYSGGWGRYYKHEHG